VNEAAAVSVVGCRHRRTTFPLTVGGRTYVCCLSCGREFEYDWQGMWRARKRWFFDYFTRKSIH
jgi:hypothetical protein